MKLAERIELNRPRAQIVLLAMEKDGLIKIEKGQGQAAITMIATQLAAAVEYGIETAANDFSTYSGYEHPLTEFIKNHILKLKE